MGRQPASYQAVILGAGPAGMGPLVCAAQRGGLDALLERGIAVVERRPGMGAGTTGRFLVNADSHPGAFLECLETPGGADLFTPVRNLAATRLLQQQRCAPVPLGLVAKYLDHLGSVLARRLVAHRRSDFFANTQARAIYLDRHGGLRIHEHDLCPLTRRVHRLGGLRGDGRQLGRQLLGLGQQPAERRVHLLPLAATSAAELRQLVRRAALIVPAFGYRPQLIPIFGADGKPIELFASAPGRGTAPRVDSHCRVLDRRGVAIPGVYALGLGWGFSPWGAMGGEPSFHGHTNGVWLYQNDLGALILRQVAASA